MKKQWSEVWYTAVPFLQKGRPGDLLHTAVAMQHLEEIMLGEGVEDEILMPTVILHDIGWSACPREAVRSFFSSVKDADTSRQMRVTHMEAGAKLCRQVLLNYGYEAGQVEQIASIIQKHDLPDEMTSTIEQLVFDADYSWRFSQAGFYLDLERFAEDPEFNADEALRRLDDCVSSLKTSTGRRIAERELKARKYELRGL
jgi:hypothetical protein